MLQSIAVTVLFPPPPPPDDDDDDDDDDDENDDNDGENGVIILNILPLKISHTAIDPSCAPDAINFPFGDTATAVTGFPCAAKSRTQPPLPMSHIRTQQSADPVTTYPQFG